MSEPRRCRMFPLGSVLLPEAPLPLHVFEPRYQQLLNETLEDDRTFGVVLITHGSEVGGGDTRSTVGTRATIDDHSRFDDGRAAVAARGLDRIEIVEWLPDDPYPVAMVIDRPTAPIDAGDDHRLTEAQAALDGLIDVARRLGRLRQAPELAWSDDLVQASWQLAAAAPISTLDRQRVLELDRVGERLDQVTTTVREMTDDLERLAELDQG